MPTQTIESEETKVEVDDRMFDIMDGYGDDRVHYPIEGKCASPCTDNACGEVEIDTGRYPND